MGKLGLKRILLLLVSLLLALSLTGCSYPELYERVLIHGIGVDWTGEGYKVTVRSSVSPEDEGEELFTFEGKTVLDALSSLSLSTGREPFYAHNYLVVFGMDCARRGLDDCLDFFVRYYNTRPAVKLFVSEGTAEELLSVEQEGKLMKMSQLQALATGGDYNGMTAQVDILDFVNGVKSEGGASILPVLRATDEGVEVASAAYFEDCAVKGSLTLEQTRGWLAVTGRLDRGELTVSEEELGTVTLSLRGVDTRVEPDLSEGIGFTMTVKVDADVSSVDRGGRAGENIAADTFYSVLEDSAARLLESEIISAVFQATEQDRCDIFGFGNLLYRKHPGLWWQHEGAWRDELPSCRFDTDVSVKVRRLEQENLNGF